MDTVQERVRKISDNTNLSLDTPYTTAKIELTGICTLNCKFCYNRTMKKNKIRQKQMSLSDLNFVIEELKKIPTLKEVGLFYMGESGLNRNLAEGYKLLKEAGYFTYLTTNATEIKYILQAVPYIDSLKVSWNYKDLNDFINKTGSSPVVYYCIINNIKKLYRLCHQYNKELTISTVLDSDKKEYDNIIQKLEYDYHYFIPLQTQGGISIDGADGVIGESEHPSKPIPCWSLFKGIYIDVDLNIRTCCYGHNNDHIIGNLRDKDLRNILCETKLLNMKQQHLKGEIPEECFNCLRNQK